MDAEGEKLPPAPPSDQEQEAIPWPWLSVALALRVVVPPEATVVGFAEALPDRVWLLVAGCTVRETEALLLRGLLPLQVALTVSEIVRLLVVVFAGAL